MSLVPARIANDYSKIYRPTPANVEPVYNPYKKPEPKKSYEHIVSGNIHCDSNDLSREQIKVAADAAGFSVSLVHKRAIAEAYDSLFFGV